VRDRLAVQVITIDGERAPNGDPYVTDAERRGAGVETERDVRRRLRPGNRRLARSRYERRDDPLPADVPLWRIWRPRDPAELRARLGDERSVRWTDGDVLELLWRGNADDVACIGAIQLPFWRVGRSDLWELSVRIARLDEAVISVVPLPRRHDEPRFGGMLEEQPLHLRGARAPQAPRTAEIAPIATCTLEGDGIGPARPVSVWRPPRSAGPLPVVYCADGATTLLAPTIAAAIEDGHLPPLLLVGIESGRVERSIDRRAQEYLPGVSRRRFAAHERFVLDVVLPYAEREHGASDDPAKRFTYGFSNGACWALAMAQRHPSQLAGAAALSVAGGDPRRVRRHPGQRYALCAGTLEHGFRRSTASWAHALGRDPSVHVAHVERVAGHDPGLWREQAPWALAHLVAGLNLD
jgi:hypothetical protein